MINKNNQKKKFQQFETLSISLQIQNQGIIVKNINDLKGNITIKPKAKIINFPVEIQIFGKSCCNILDKIENNCKDQIQLEINDSKNIQITQSNIIEQHQKQQYFYSSFQQLKEATSQNNDQNLQILKNTQEFLQGKQVFYQLNQFYQKRLILLEQNIEYKYPFIFNLPKQLPISLNTQIIPGINLFIEYTIEVFIEIKPSQLLIYKKQKQQKNKMGQTIKLKQKFYVINQEKKYPYQILTNQLFLKYYHVQGAYKNQQKFCCKYLYNFLNCILYSFTKNKKNLQIKGSYDIYNCETSVTVNKQNILHLTIRLFKQPNILDQRKIKKGRIYETTVKNKIKDKNIIEKQIKNQITIEKINQQKKQQNQIKIKFLNVKMYGQIANIRKFLVFQKIIYLSQKKYDMLQGQNIIEIDKKYFSQKNELFQIKYWFEIQPIQNQFVQKYYTFQQISSQNVRNNCKFNKKRNIPINQINQQINLKNKLNQKIKIIQSNIYDLPL